MVIARKGKGVPDRRSSSLSFAEPPPSTTLQDWVDRSLTEGLSLAKRTGAALLWATSMELRAGLPLRAFDSPIEDAFLFGGRDRVVMGVGVAKTFESERFEAEGQAEQADVP